MTVRAFHARSKRIVEPGVIDAAIDLAFGVALSRRIRIEAAPACPARMRAAAMHCLVIVCGGKSLFVTADDDQRDHLIRAQVAVFAKRPPPDCVVHGGGGALLDVGQFLAFMQGREYPVRDVRRALNG